MVDCWLIAVGEEAQDVVRGGENQQQRDKRDPDPEADFLYPLAQRPSKQRLEGVEDEMPAVQERYRQKVHEADGHGKPRRKAEQLPRGRDGPYGACRTRPDRRP